MTLSALGVFSAAGAGGGGAVPAFELISTTILTGTQASVSFDVSSFASTYRHLQLRYTSRSTNASVEDFMYLRFNGATTGYTSHGLVGTGSGVVSGNETSSHPNGVLLATGTSGANSPTNAFGAGVVDILDCFSTSKNKTTRNLSGNLNPSYVRMALSGGSWMSTSATTSISIHGFIGSLVAGSRFSLYGIKG